VTYVFVLDDDAGALRYVWREEEMVIERVRKRRNASGIVYDGQTNGRQSVSRKNEKRDDNNINNNNDNGDVETTDG